MHVIHIFLILRELQHELNLDNLSKPSKTLQCLLPIQFLSSLILGKIWKLLLKEDFEGFLRV